MLEEQAPEAPAEAVASNPENNIDAILTEVPKQEEPNASALEEAPAKQLEQLIESSQILAEQLQQISAANNAA